MCFLSHYHMMYFLFLSTALMKITALKCGHLSFLSDDNTLMHQPLQNHSNARLPARGLMSKFKFNKLFLL